MSDLFQPQRADGKSDWRVVHEIFVALKPGEVVSLQTILDALETTDRSRMYRAVQRAKQELWESQQSIDSIKGVGYQLLQASEFEKQSLSYKRRSRRQLGKAIRVANATPLAELDSPDRVRMIHFQSAMVALGRAMDQTMAQVADHEERIRRLEEG